MSIIYEQQQQSLSPEDLFDIMSPVWDKVQYHDAAIGPMNAESFLDEILRTTNHPVYEATIRILRDICRIWTPDATSGRFVATWSGEDTARQLVVTIVKVATTKGNAVLDALQAAPEGLNPALLVAAALASHPLSLEELIRLEPVLQRILAAGKDDQADIAKVLATLQSLPAVPRRRRGHA